MAIENDRIEAVSWPYSGRIEAVSWPYRGRIEAVQRPYRGCIEAVSRPYLMYPFAMIIFTPYKQLFNIPTMRTSVKIQFISVKKHGLFVNVSYFMLALDLFTFTFNSIRFIGV